MVIAQQPVVASAASADRHDLLLVAHGLSALDTTGALPRAVAVVIAADQDDTFQDQAALEGQGQSALAGPADQDSAFVAVGLIHHPHSANYQTLS